MTDTAGFFIGATALQAAVLLAGVTVLAAAAQTVGARLGLTVWDLGGRQFLAFVAVGVVAFLFGGILAAVSVDPSLASFAGISLPFAGWSQRPEAGHVLLVSLGATVVLGGAIADRVSKRLRPLDVALQSARSVQATTVLDALYATEGLPEPHEVDSPFLLTLTAISLSQRPWGDLTDAERSALVDDVQASRDEQRNSYRQRSETLRRKAGAGEARNPLDPAAKAIRLMIEQRSAGDLATAWRVFVAALMPLIVRDPETDADDAWPTSTHDRDIVEAWLWETMGDMVRLAYGVDFDRGVSIIVREMKTAFGLSVQYDQRGTLGTRRRLSTVAWLAIERQDSESFEAVVEVYESTALDGLNSDDAVMFGQAVLGLGHLAETTVALAPPPQAVRIRHIEKQSRGIPAAVCSCKPCRGAIDGLGISFGSVSSVAGMAPSEGRRSPRVRRRGAGRYGDRSRPSSNDERSRDQRSEVWTGGNSRSHRVVRDSGFRTRCNGQFT